MKVLLWLTGCWKPLVGKRRVIIFPLRLRPLLLQIKSINLSGGMLDGTTDHPAPVSSLWLRPATNALLNKHNMGNNIWWQLCNLPKIFVLTPLTGKLCGGKDFFPVLGVGFCRVEWWLSFCNVRLVICWLSLHDCPHLPKLSLLG